MAKKKYTITFNFNGQKIKKLTDDINASIIAVTPDEVFTESFISVKKDEHVMDRSLNLIQTRKLFQDEDFRGIFINNLLFT